MTMMPKTDSFGQNYFPDGEARQAFYNPVDRGFEREVRKRLDYWSYAESVQPLRTKSGFLSRYKRRLRSAIAGCALGAFDRKGSRVRPGCIRPNRSNRQLGSNHLRQLCRRGFREYRWSIVPITIKP